MKFKTFNFELKYFWKWQFFHYENFLRFKNGPQLPGAGRTRAGHHHGSHMPTSPGAILLSKMACQPKHIGHQCICWMFSSIFRIKERQNVMEDCANICVLLRKAELYLIKCGFSKKTQNIWKKISYLFWRYWVDVKTSGRFFSNFVSRVKFIYSEKADKILFEMTWYHQKKFRDYVIFIIFFLDFSEYMNFNQ